MIKIFEKSVKKWDYMLEREIKENKLEDAKILSFLFFFIGVVLFIPVFLTSIDFWYSVWLFLGAIISLLMSEKIYKDVKRQESLKYER